VRRCGIQTPGPFPPRIPKALLHLPEACCDAGGRAVSKRLSEKTSQLREDAVNAAKISVLVLVTLLGVLYVLDY